MAPKRRGCRALPSITRRFRGLSINRQIRLWVKLPEEAIFVSPQGGSGLAMGSSDVPAHVASLPRRSSSAMISGWRAICPRASADVIFDLSQVLSMAARPYSAQSHQEGGPLR